MTQKRSRAAFEADLRAQQSPYVAYGTPLPPLDPEVRDDGSYVPVWKQEVTDEQGRKRLHGAFTGGFSAGYFNTVGSKEGWAPSAFVSSRANRKKDADKIAQQRPEDFMDDEDLADTAEAQRLETTDAFGGLGSTAEESRSRGLWMDVSQPEGDTMGVKLLRKMGWRDGQGVGPKVRRKARLDDQDDGEGQEQAVHLFAPENSSMVSFNRKHDHKGLGYEGEGRLLGSDARESPAALNREDDAEDPPFQRPNGAKQQKKEGSRKGGFGVGILNDTGSDDEDPYATGPRISYNRVIGSEKKKKKKLENEKFSTGAANPLLGIKPIFISKKAVSAKMPSSFRKCNDGRLPLDGFILASGNSLMLQKDEIYRTPEIPKGWKSSRTSSSYRTTSDYKSTADAAKSSTLDPKSRASLLGEAPLPGKSVFDFLSTSARDRIANASGKANLPAAMGEAAPHGFSMSDEEKQKELWNLVPNLEKDVAFKALGRGVGGWMPYAEDEGKRARYRAFLEIRSGLSLGLPLRAEGAPKDEWAQELREFAHAAQVFKPLTGMMATRFTTSTSQPRLASDAVDGKLTDSLLTKPVERPEDPAEAAAKVGMYGPMTRSIQQFYPTRLLCKRFNVKPPAHVQLDPDKPPDSAGRHAAAEGRFQPGGYQTHSSAIPGAKLELVSKEAIDNMLRDSRPNTQAQPVGGVSGDIPVIAEKTKEVVVDAERNEALEGERAGAAIFMAIFGSDNEDEDND
ncbi:MAG: hypothetical protein M1827_003315 [Pycnora praestabilis]|nr:MAG: hypothetical protein M1827_003315 [Pycnora praestabilis]